MKIFKTIINLIFEPVRFIGSRNLSNVIVQLFDKHKWLIYVLAIIITASIFLIINI